MRRGRTRYHWLTDESTMKSNINCVDAALYMIVMWKRCRALGNIRSGSRSQVITNEPNGLCLHWRGCDRREQGSDNLPTLKFILPPPPPVLWSIQGAHSAWTSLHPRIWEVLRQSTLSTAAHCVHLYQVMCKWHQAAAKWAHWNLKHIKSAARSLCALLFQTSDVIFFKKLHMLFLKCNVMPLVEVKQN